jgi:hypothetical protein
MKGEDTDGGFLERGSYCALCLRSPSGWVFCVLLKCDWTLHRSSHGADGLVVGEGLYLWLVPMKRSYMFWRVGSDLSVSRESPPHPVHLMFPLFSVVRRSGPKR